MFTLIDYRLCQYTTKFIKAILQLYYRRYAKKGSDFLDYIHKLQDLEQHFLTSRRLVSFGRCTDQLFSAIKSLQFHDPITRLTLSTSKLSLSFQMFADHVLCLNQLGFLRVDKEIWVERANKFWLYSAISNLLRDVYELICIIQLQRSRTKDNLESQLRNFAIGTPLIWARKYPKLSCDLIKNCCDFWIPYTAVNKIELHPILIAMLGITSTTMGILQIYNEDCRITPS